MANRRPQHAQPVDLVVHATFRSTSKVLEVVHGFRPVGRPGVRRTAGSSRQWSRAIRVTWPARFAEPGSPATRCREDPSAIVRTRAGKHQARPPNLYVASTSANAFERFRLFRPVRALDLGRRSRARPTPITWAWIPHMSATTSTMRPAAARSMTWLRASRRRRTSSKGARRLRERGPFSSCRELCPHRSSSCPGHAACCA
jgi:hypothetical protein